MSTLFGPSQRRAMCTGESVNTVRRRRVPGPLVPDAAGPDQRAFEARLLLNWMLVTPMVMPSFIAAVHPSPDGLSIKVSRPAYVLLLLNRLPVHQVHVQRDYLELRQFGPANEIVARVRLVMPRHAARELLSRVRVGPPRAEVLDVSESVAWVLSGVLRRFSLWRAAADLSIGVEGTSVTIKWVGRPSSVAIGQLLALSSCAIPSVTMFASSTHVGEGLVLYRVRWPPPEVPEQWWAWAHVARVGRAA